MQVFRNKNIRFKMSFQYSVFIFILKIFLLSAINLNIRFVDGLPNPDFYAPVEMMKRNGYAVETYHVRTPDGYILELHRIPYGKTNKDGSHFPILCVHGYLSSSFAWIANGPERALAYLLADQGYDVWMINLRGNRYSRQHVYYTPKDPKFWDFSFDEMGSIDLPTTIDFILETTNHTQLLCMSDSAGNSIFYVMLSVLPQYNDKIVAHVCLALIYHPKTIPDSELLMISNKNSATSGVLGPIMEHDEIMKLGIQFISKPLKLDGYTAYDHLLYVTYGLRPDHINREIMPSVYANFPAGSSIKVSNHVSQIQISFSHYDYGPVKNLQIYGTQLPPEYNISNIRIPVRIYYAKADFVSTPEHVRIFYDKLPMRAGLLEIADPNFSHMDFIYNANNNELFHYDLIQFVNDVVSYTLSHEANPNIRYGDANVRTASDL
ncbi:lipase 3-like [Planococcus citri]|uniref:lipase 3-like n=1 Tax=Planococcus citri TaxID=170843 RepID=UPI0031F8919E